MYKKHIIKWRNIEDLDENILKSRFKYSGNSINISQKL